MHTSHRPCVGEAWRRAGGQLARGPRQKKKAEKSAERGRARLGKPSFLSGTPPGAARAPLPRNKTHPPVEDGSMICRRSKAMASPPCTDCQQAEESGPRCRRRRDALNSRRRTSSGVPLAPRTAMMPHMVAGWTVLCVCVWKRSGGAVRGVVSAGGCTGRPIGGSETRAEKLRAQRRKSRACCPLSLPFARRALGGLTHTYTRSQGAWHRRSSSSRRPPALRARTLIKKGVPP